MVKKSDFIWNTLGSGISAILSAVLLLLATRINGTYAAGMFSIAFATATILNGIGDYGIRLYQVTDSRRMYKFGEYKALRFIVVLTMIIIGVIFVFASGYELEKLLICICLVLFKAIDNLSDTYQGEFQLQDRLDISGKSIVIRNTIAIILFGITNYVTRNLVLSTFILFITNMILFVLYDKNKIKKYTNEKMDFNKKTLKILLKECFPVCISTLLSMYVTNAVKYAIDSTGDYDMQTYYNIIYLPVFTINLACLFIIKPMLKSFGDYWNNGKTDKLTKLIIKIFLIIIVISIVVELVCYLIGIQVLGFIYGVNLENYKTDLLILILSGMFYAISVLMWSITVTIRKQKITTIVYGVVSAIALVITNIFVKNCGMRGASIANVIITFLLAIGLSIIYIVELKRKEIQNENINNNSNI